MVFPVGATLRLYNEDLWQPKEKVRESLETVVEDIGEEKT
jgi:hypothetical protein